jgi:hypothetical protein
MSVTVVHDAIHVNVPHLPPGMAAGYTTGSTDIQWTAADWHAHPGAVRIDQDASASDPQADVLDVESFAATNAESAGWYRRALASFNAGTRPGQRHPAIYCSAGNVTALVNALIAGGVRSGPNLWVAKWDFSSVDDIAAINNASGPFPIIGGQFSDGQFYDSNVFSSAWLANTSMPPLPKPPATPAQVEANGRQSWRELAHAHGTTVVRSLELTVEHQHGQLSQPRQAAYVAVGDWNAILPGPAGNVPGVKIWVGN